jgi:hypothetical protein
MHAILKMFKEEIEIKKPSYFSYLLLLIVMTINAQEKDLPKLAGPYLGQKPPGTTPERFAPEIIPDHFFPHSRLIISPDGKRIYWTAFLNM